MSRGSAGRVEMGTALALALFSVANGARMLLDPQGWFTSTPGVAATGGFNAHFVRDLGIVYVLTGAALLAGARLASARSVLWTVAAGWLSAHAAFHVIPTISGETHGALLPDLLGVVLPGLLASVLAARSCGRNSA